MTQDFPARLSRCLRDSLMRSRYRWTDEKGRVHVTDTPPPASAKDVRKTDSASGTAKPAAAALPYELAPACRRISRSRSTPRRTARKPAPARARCSTSAACRSARSRSGTRRSHEELKASRQARTSAGADRGPARAEGLRGRRYDALLDSAGYPGAGLCRRDPRPRRPARRLRLADAEPAAKAASAEAARKAGPTTRAACKARRRNPVLTAFPATPSSPAVAG